jgi:hypothetical protein
MINKIKFLKNPIVLGVIFALSAGYAFTEGPGHATDWSTFRAWTLGLPHEMGVWNPYWGKLILNPIASLPQDPGHLILNFITYTALLFSSGQIWSFLTFATNDQVWVGNLDGFIILGMCLARRRHPFVIGTGLFLISIKPQFLPLGLYYILKSRNYRIFIVPGLLLILSLLLYGNWFPEWLATFPPTPHQSVNVSFYPWGLALWLLLPLAADKERFVLAATVLSSPYFNQASLITLFAFHYLVWAALPLIFLSWISPVLVAPFVLVYALLSNPEGFKFKRTGWDYLTTILNCRMC